MGGDNAPEAIVAGVELARDQMPDTEFLLFGQLDKVKPNATSPLEKSAKPVLSETLSSARVMLEKLLL